MPLSVIKSLNWRLIPEMSGCHYPYYSIIHRTYSFNIPRMFCFLTTLTLFPSSSALFPPLSTVWLSLCCFSLVNNSFNLNVSSSTIIIVNSLCACMCYFWCFCSYKYHQYMHTSQDFYWLPMSLPRYFQQHSQIHERDYWNNTNNWATLI